MTEAAPMRQPRKRTRKPVRRNTDPMPEFEDEPEREPVEGPGDDK
jgi:hypothetical protein